MLPLPNSPWRRPLAVVGIVAIATQPLVGAGDVIISEFLAVNVDGARDEDGDQEDWIELSNTTAAPVDLSGWYLTDSASRPTQWRIPDGTALGPGGELLVFASGKNREVGELHTNFKLSAGGEYLALVRADGATVEFGYAPAYPAQYPDVSYGIGTPGGASTLLVPPSAPVRWKVPGDASEHFNNPAVQTSWIERGFDDSTWTSSVGGVGFPRVETDRYYEFIGEGSDLKSSMQGINETAYVRFPFEVDDPAEVTSLALGARWEDGFAAFINGVHVASANSPAEAELAWDSGATASHSDSLAVALEQFDIDRATVPLAAGTNVLAVQVLNRGTGSSDLLFDPELEAVITPSGDAEEAVYMLEPTPGTENGAGVGDLGPVFRAATETAPAIDLGAQSAMVVTARVEAAGEAVASVEVFYRRMFASESSAPMLDDGGAPDAVAGDGVYSASVPLAGLAAGEMLRWRFEARDAGGATSRAPFFHDPLNSPEYFGTIAADPSIATPLPVLHWFPQSFSAAGTRTGTRAAIYHDGEFYDNVFNRVRGGSSTGLSKKSYKLDFNSGHHFRWSDEAPRAEEINLNTTWTDKTYIRQALSFEVFDLAGSPGCESFPVQVRRNGEFFSVAAFVEQVDKRLLDREPRVDRDGALYKMFNTFTSGTSGVEKKNRRQEPNSDLVGFVAAINGNSGAALENVIFDQVDIPRQLNYLAGGVLCQNDDNSTKNYYLYRDSEGTGEWFQIAWDLDLTWGSHFMTGDSIAHDGIWADADYVLGGSARNVPISPSHPFVGTRDLPPNRNWNRLADKLYSNDRFAEMFRRRLRTLMDELFAPPLLDDRLAGLEVLLNADAALDRAAWGQFGQSQTLAQAMDVLATDYLGVRRTHLFETHLAGNAAGYPTPQTSSALLPDAQPAGAALVFASFEASPPSGDQDEEYIELQNPNPYAVDLSGWSLDGGVRYTFLDGVVLEAGGSLFVSPDVPAFRSRATSPTGGEGNFVQGDYDGQLSSRGETVLLRDRAGEEVASLSVPPDPSAAQRWLRITELFYDPPGGSGAEYIELKNVGGDPLDLAGVSFTDGVEFSFPAGASLAPGEVGILVSDPAAYPAANVLGTYAGALNNGGEQVTLRDADGENVLSFEYDGDWFPPARGGGYSIVIIDELAPWDRWDSVDGWALSCEIGGSPSAPNPSEHSTAYAVWARAHLTTEQLADPQRAAPHADADGDGVSNLLGYALGGGLEALPTSGEHDGYPTLTYRARLKAADLVYQVETSTDLAAWTPAGTTTGLPVDNGDGTFSFTVRTESRAADAPQQFLRLRIFKIL